MLLFLNRFKFLPQALAFFARGVRGGPRLLGSPASSLGYGAQPFLENAASFCATTGPLLVFPFGFGLFPLCL